MKNRRISHVARTGISLPDELFQKARKHAADKGQALSVFLKNLLEDYFEEIESQRDPEQELIELIDERFQQLITEREKARSSDQEQDDAE